MSVTFPIGNLQFKNIYLELIFFDSALFRPLLLLSVVYCVPAGFITQNRLRKLYLKNRRGSLVADGEVVGGVYI